MTSDSENNLPLLIVYSLQCIFSLYNLLLIKVLWSSHAGIIVHILQVVKGVLKRWVLRITMIMLFISHTMSKRHYHYSNPKSSDSKFIAKHTDNGEKFGHPFCSVADIWKAFQSLRHPVVKTDICFAIFDQPWWYYKGHISFLIIFPFSINLSLSFVRVN